MGPFIAGRFQRFTLSREWPRRNLKADEADEPTPTSGRFGYDTSRQEAFDWRELDDSDEDYLDKARGW